MAVPLGNAAQYTIPGSLVFTDKDKDVLPGTAILTVREGYSILG